MEPYQIILADPPWKYNSRANHKTRFRGGADGHYSLLTLDEIGELYFQGLNNLMADDCLLFLWGTYPMLREALDVIGMWYFEYKTIAFQWMKLNKINNKPFFGVGYYTKSNSEPCLFATRGKVIKPVRNDISQIVMSPRFEHSHKPMCVKLAINMMYPNLRKLELFAREYTPGWDATGLDLDGKDIREFLKEV